MKIENLKVYNFDEAIRASKFPMICDVDDAKPYVTETTEKLATSKKGEGHDNFLCGIVVSFDLTFTNKAWVEMERYHFIDIVSSQSTMHRIAKLSIAEQCNEYVDTRIINIAQQLQERYNVDPIPENYLRLLYSIPSGFQLTAHIVTNYRQLKTIYAQRNNHRLPEWREFCAYMADNLPHGNWIAGEKGDVLHPIKEDEMSSRLYRALVNHNIKNYEDISAHTSTEIKDFRNLGDKSYDELLDLMQTYRVDFLDNKRKGERNNG